MSAPVAPRIAYVNGRYLPLAEATLPIMDRGFLFGDGIYEVTAVLGDHFVDNEPHLARLDRSLKAIGIRNPHTIPEWTAIQRELVRQNDLKQGTVYIEVTRGTYEREFTCPDDIAPNVVMFTQAKNLLANPMAETGAAVITVDDLRWARRDIKSVALLAQVLAKFEARRAGVAEAVMLEDGVVTEGGFLDLLHPVERGGAGHAGAVEQRPPGCDALLGDASCARNRAPGGGAPLLAAGNAGCARGLLHLGLILRDARGGGRWREDLGRAARSDHEEAARDLPGGSAERLTLLRHGRARPGFGVLERKPI